MSNNRKVELGHYVDGENEYGEKIYITGTYKNKNGETKQFINATKLTLADLIELQQLDLTGKKEKVQTSKEQKPKQKAGRPKQSKGKANLQVVGGSDTASLFD
jgi:hypothetical protein